MKAVIDRFEGDYTVTILENGQVTNILTVLLPDSASEGSYLKIDFVDDQHIKAIQLDDVATDNARQRIQEKLERLRRNEHLLDD